MVNPADPVKVITGLPLLVRVSSAPVSVASDMSIAPKDVMGDGAGLVLISNEPTSLLPPDVSVA